MEHKYDGLSVILEECREACLDFISDNLSSTESHVLKSIEFCKDCEKVCELTLSYINRRSHYSKKVLKLCSEICHKCADELLRSSSAEAKKCADICRHCARETAAAS